MQRTIRVLRIALPIAFVGFIAFIALSWDRSGGRKMTVAAGPVTSTQRPEDEPQAESTAFEDVQTIGGRVVSRIRAQRVVAFRSGWTTLEGVTLTLYRANGLTYTVSCPEAQFNTRTKEAEAKGGVRVSSSDGIEIATAQIRYDGARLTNDIPVEFRIDRWNGKAGALDLDVQNEILRLHKDVAATMASAHPNESPMTLQGSESIFRRHDNTVEFHRDVRMERGADSARADFMRGRFTQDRRQLIGLEGSGNCAIVMAANPLPGEDLGGRKEITADGFMSEVGPDGHINAINFISAANAARATLDGPPKREIVARGFRVALSGRAVSEMKASFGVTMKELGPATRQINTEHITVHFDPATRRARSAYLQGGFRYQDPTTTASAFRANYDIVGDRIILTTDPGWQATVVTDGQTLKAKQIEFSPRAETARASGSVIAQLASKGKGGGATADTTSLFPAGAPVFVNSDELVMRNADKIALFSGNVRAWQENNTILANELQVQGNGEIITARGNVRSQLYNTTAEKRTTPVQSRSEQLVARKAENRIELLGGVTITDETRSLASETATLFLDEKRKIERMQAEENVVVAESASGRKGTGTKAVYDVEKKMIFVYGAPATISDPSGSVAGQEIVFDLARNRVQVVSPDGKTKGTYKHEG